MEKITAPFTEEQVKALNFYQAYGALHPFTCCSPEDIPECTRQAGYNDGVLIASTEGFVCPCGQYTQNWAHKFMSDPPPIHNENHPF